MRPIFKITLVISALLLFSASVLAEVKLVSPVEKLASESQVIQLDAAQAGEIIELIFSNNSGTDLSWVRVFAQSLPEGWTASEIIQERNKNTLILQVAIPKDSENGAFQFSIGLENSKGFVEEAGFLAFVQDDLITSQVDSLKKTADSGEEISFVYTISNNSIAEHRVEISSSLPLTWFKPITVDLKPKSSKQVIVKISPKSYGEKKFSFYTKSLLTDKTINEINPKVEINPTLKSKYESALYGFPFFTPSLIPYYIFNSFISQLA